MINLVRKVLRRLLLSLLRVYLSFAKNMNAFELMIELRGFDKFLQMQVSKIGLLLYKRSHGTVQYGPYKGMRISSNSTWSSLDLGSKILGSYEYSIASTLEKISDFRFKVSGQRNLTLCDIGASDGFFAIGSVFSQKYEQSVAFETNIVSRETIQNMAKKNKVESRVMTLGTATADFLELLKEFPNWKIENSVFLIDIEGSEYHLLTRENLEKLHLYSPLIIEVHPLGDRRIRDSMNILKERALQFYKVYELQSDFSKPGFSSRDPLFDDLNDISFLLALSEGRPFAMSWLVCIPKTWENFSVF